MKLALGTAAPIVAQLMLAVLAMVLIAFAPPAHGRMLLVPLNGHPVSRATIEGLHATPLLPGPLPGSWVVDGDRQRLSPLWADNILVMAAPAALCSSV